MITKHLAIAAAFVLMTGLSSAPASAQDTAPATPAATATAAPAAGGQQVLKANAAAEKKNPYGLGHIIEQKNPVSMTILIILLVMSVGTWYIFFVKFFEQARILGQAKSVERRFWTSATLTEGIEKLPKTSEFRGIAEAGVRASQGGRRPRQGRSCGSSATARWRRAARR